MLLGLDFDGTLLRSDGTISQRTLDALGAARNAGWLVVGATGRPPALAEVVTSQIDDLTHVVTNNGSLTIDALTGQITHQVACTAEDARWAGDRIRAAVTDAGMAIDHVDGDQTWEQGFDSRVPSPPMGELVNDVLTTIDGQVRKLLAWSDAVLVDDLYRILHGLLSERLDVTHSGLPFLEVGPFGVSKATALHRLAERHGIAAGDTIVFGDARNDHEMLCWAGVGVAMGNADNETQRLADVVTESNDDDGVARYIERLLAV